ncbi:MAG TPA: GNAT family N-acetyltransferase [candidate division Zixibacteria bacterium]|nr:GNAT family N-acetyltransferase [candidate division Zixibacteria bacterium]
MKIRKATSEDIPSIVNVWEKSDLPIRSLGRDHPDNLAKQLLESNMWILIGEINEEIVGVIMVTHDSRKGWINRLAIIPSKRNKGLGMLLLEEAEKTLVEEGIDIFCAVIHNDNTSSRKLFEKANYLYHEDITYYAKRNKPDI